jgi:GNAT superfamily N-acetyltransferase
MIFNRKIEGHPILQEQLKDLEDVIPNFVSAVPAGEMKIRLRRDLNPATDFYYNLQFEIYHEPYLIWDRDTWESIIATCDIYRIEGDGKYIGDVILEDKGKGAKYIIDFSILPEYQRKGIGKTVLEEVKNMGRRLFAVTRKETLDFFLKSGFVLKRTIRNYYDPGVDGYDLIFVNDGRRTKRESKPGMTRYSPSS